MRQADSPVVDFLSEFAHCLVAAGITNQRLVGMVRLAFFRAASANAKFSNARLNQSDVAAMTGLTRLQVRQFAKQSSPTPSEKPDRIENVIDGWTADTSFTTPTHSPKRLRITGRGSTFNLLVKKYGGDIPHRAILREMQRHGYVTVRDGFVSLKRIARKTRDESRLHRLSSALADLLRRSSAGQSALSPLRTINIEISYPSTSDRGRVLLHKRTAEGLSAFLARIQAAGVAASIESPPSARQKGKISRTRVLLLTEDLED